MELRQIRYFLTLAETLNFTRAAEMSGVAQPALTKAVQRLEEELGGPLVFRDGRDTRLTELSRTIRGEFEKIVTNEMRARELAERIVREDRTIISIGLAATMGPKVVWRFLEAFLASMPQVELLFETVNPKLAGELVLSGAVDASFCTEAPRSHPKLRALPLFHERLLLAVAQDHPFAGLPEVSPDALSLESYIDRVNCEFRERVIDHFMDRDILMRPQIQSDREDWVQHAVAQGFGIALLPEHSCLRDDLSLVSVRGLTLSREISLLTVFGSASAPAIQRLRTAAQAHDWPPPGVSKL